MFNTSSGFGLLHFFEGTKLYDKIQNKLKYAFLQIPGRDSYVKKNIFNFRNRFQIFIYLNIQW